MSSNPDLTEHERTIFDAQHTAELFISKIAKRLSRSRAAIRRYIKDSMKCGKNNGVKRNLKLSLQDWHNINNHGIKGAVASSTVKKYLNIAHFYCFFRKILLKHEGLK